MSLFVAHFRRRTNVGFWVLADLIIDDDGVSACDAGYDRFLCFASGVDTLVKRYILSKVSATTPTRFRLTLGS